MSSRKKSSVNDGEYSRFEAALTKVLSVPHSKIKSKLDNEKKKRAKRASSFHAATSKA